MKRMALNWAGPALCSILVIYVVNERTRALEGKVSYQRDLITALRKEVRELHEEWQASVNDIRGDLREPGPLGPIHEAKGNRP